jgi:two-component system, response regulator YesN
MPSKILLVDDDKDFRDEFRECFEAYEIIEAGDGEEALRILKKPNDIDLVILDVKLPGVKGTEVLREIKAIAPDLGIIILTGHSSEDVAIEALKGHADEYIEKPLNVNKTRELIEDLLDAGSGLSAVVGIEDKIEKAKRFMERNCYKKVTLEDAAKAVSLSPKYFSRIFKETTGTGFSEYRSRIRIREAKLLLKNTALNIAQIAYKIGYQNMESFTRLFKSSVGQTPTGYRKKYAVKGRKKS